MDQQNIIDNSTAIASTAIASTAIADAKISCGGNSVTVPGATFENLVYAIKIAHLVFDQHSHTVIPGALPTETLVKRIKRSWASIDAYAKTDHEMYDAVSDIIEILQKDTETRWEFLDS